MNGRVAPVAWTGIHDASRLLPPRGPRAGTSVSGEGEARLILERLQLIEGAYFLDVAAHQRDGYPFDYHRALYTFRVNSRIKDLGIYRPSHRWEFTPNIVIRPPESP